MASNFWKPLTNIFKSGCLTCFVLNYIGDLVLYTDSSMEPTLHNGDIILTEYMTLPKHYDIGDIVIARSPANPLLHSCKRIIGLPGDRLYHGNSLQYVPTGYVWLQSDNLESSDAQCDGPVPQGLLIGRAVCILWPLSHIVSLTNKKYRPVNVVRNE